MEFQGLFRKITENPPYPWQNRFYQSIVQGRIPQYLDIPTGLGKTSIIPIWLIAVEKSLELGTKVPARLVYIVDRRVIVDQATAEVKKIIKKIEETAELKNVKHLNISTLRGGGGMSDSRRWLSHPEEPAIIIGTIDMIGSRLFFSGYGISHKIRSFYAGFLGQDSLIVLDEAHLSLAMMKSLSDMMLVSRNAKNSPFPPKVLFMSATQPITVGSDKVFKIGDDDRKNSRVEERYTAKKTLNLIETDEVVESIIEYSKKIEGKVLIYLQKPEDVQKIREQLEKEGKKAIMLTGTLRGYERDNLVDDEIWKSFTNHSYNSKETKFLVSTSAGEVGVDIDADHMICDITTFDSLVQRIGRVNRSGKNKNSKIFVMYSDADLKKSKISERLEKTKILLKKLTENAGWNASPSNIEKIDNKTKQDASAPPPTTQPLTADILETWALTSINHYPSRPNVRFWLRGKDEHISPETHIAWRNDVKYLAEVEPERIQDVLEAYRIMPHETARDYSRKVYRLLENIKNRSKKAIILKSDGTCMRKKIQDIIIRDIEFATIILPCEAGGLNERGFMTNVDRSVKDVADESRYLERVRLLVRHDEGQSMVLENFADDVVDVELSDWQKDNPDMRMAECISKENQDETDQYEEIQYYVKKPERQTTRSTIEQSIEEHHTITKQTSEKILKPIPLSDSVKNAIVIASSLHDEGKKRDFWQECMKVNKDKRPLAKTDHRSTPLNMNGFRHELASVIDCRKYKEVMEHREKDLILHLIAAHHGWARPSFLVKALDHESGNKVLEKDRDFSIEIMNRYYKMQKRFGIWGLAYLEGLVRGADWQASDLGGNKS